MTISRRSNTSPGLAARAGLALVRGYQHWLSPLKPRTCRYYPSCSEYAVHAIAARGLFRGLLLAAWRVLRCNPFSRGGYDPGPWAQDASRREGSP
jgi:putative membrane protein insertion efficiency factor